MKRVVQALTVTTFALALSTAYLARAVKMERAQAAPVAAPARVDLSTASDSPPDLRGPPEKTSAAPAGDDMVASAGRLEALRARLARLDDPVARAQAAATTRTSLERTWQPIALSMQLPPHELDWLLGILVEQSLQNERRRLECQIDPGCDLRLLEASFRESRLQNLEITLSADQFRRYEAYVDAIPERTYLRELRTRLPSSAALGDAAAEGLAMALAEERRQFAAQVERQGKKVQFSIFRVQEYEGDVAPNLLNGRSNQQMTDDYNERLGRRAAQILDRRQLAAFRKLQEEYLASGRMIEGLRQLQQ